MKQQKGWQWQRKLFIRNGQANFITNLKLFQNFAEQMIKQVVFALIIPVQETFYVYHEGTGTKGPNEVVSFLLHHLDKNPEFKNIEQFHFFSDACAAQNKNHTIVRLFFALALTNRFKKIDQYYPTRGHSFLPCDRDFSILKMKIKKSDRIYTLKEFEPFYCSFAEF